MSARFVIAGTDTGIGKTVFAAALTRALSGTYFKPVQSGLDDETDTEAARRLSGLSAEHFLPERYRLTAPLSPHRSAELDHIEIDPAKLALPRTGRPLIVETAGGLMVPLTRSLLSVDIVAGWGAPVILCARTSLGTINHSLLSLEALRVRNIDVLGIAFVGEANEDSETTICAFGKVRRLGRLPFLDPLNPASLAQGFAANFDLSDFPAIASGYVES